MALLPSTPPTGSGSPTFLPEVSSPPLVGGISDGLASEIPSSAKTSPLIGVDAKTSIYPFASGWKGRRRRILGFKENASNCYHAMSRTCGGAVIWDDVEKEALRRVLWRLSEFTGVRILTYCVMHNHFHVLAEVPNRESWLEQRFSGPEGEARLLRHLRILYSRSYIESLQVELAEWRKCGQERLAQERLEGIRRRFCDLTVFIKEVKERFSRWYNKRHQRKGTLWMDRFKSVLVEGRGEPLLTMALYIDLNPVRAGICADPQNYRWCGYAEALAGNVACQRGICRVMAHDEDAWLRRSVGEGYRRMLFDTAVEVLDDEGKVVRRGITRGEAEDVLLAGGKLSRGDLIRHRVRYFSDGVALGGREFVEAVFRRRRRQFSPQRKDGARHLAEADGQLFSLRKLRVRPIG